MVGCLAGVDPMRHHRLFKEEYCAPIESRDDERKQKTAVCGMWCPDEGFSFLLSFWFTDFFLSFFSPFQYVQEMPVAGVHALNRCWRNG